MRYISTVFFSILLIPLFGQAPKSMTSSEIYEGLKKLNTLASVLYIAAHPDDENTRMISYFSNEIKAETAYISLTRGDGGQNLIGTEIRELLGVLRTQELLAARQIDGGKQYFTRANDFGFSKHSDETFEIWNKEEIMKDLIKVIRKFQPDLLITRFDHRTPGTTHGHHTASAIMGVEAFDLAQNANYLPELPAFSPERIFFNTSWWFYGSREKFKEADKTNLYTLDAGVYYPSLGKSNTEIAAESRSQHQCQGMGRLSTRGEQIEYLEYLNGSRPTQKDDVLSGINTTWSRIQGGETISQKIQQIIENFSHTSPEKSIDALIDLRSSILTLEKNVWTTRKLKECEHLIQACSGLYIDVHTTNSYEVPGENLDYTIDIINRSNSPWKLQKVRSNTGVDSTLHTKLEKNISFISKGTTHVNAQADYSTPYWLFEEGTLGMFETSQTELIGLPETPDPIIFTFQLTNGSQTFEYHQALQYKYGDPVKGEVYQPFEILPEIFVTPKDEIVIFKKGQTQEISVTLKAGKKSLQGHLYPNLAKGWKSSPEKIDFTLTNKNEEQSYTFTITAPNEQREDVISFTVEYDNKLFSDKLYTIEYDHILTQQVLQKNDVKSIVIDLKYAGKNIGYIMGAGDKIPEALTTIGYNVTMLDAKNIRAEELRNFDCILTGIRAFNTIENIGSIQEELLKYTKDGGTVIHQYNTRHRLKSKKLGPYDIKLSRKRITDEFAPVTIMDKTHPIFNFPNKITEKDFDGWVQERGLYFPDEWDTKYTTLLASSDKGEEPLNGGFLYTKYGKGHYIYTGYSFFRELPAGVPGAYRLFANMVSIGKK